MAIKVGFERALTQNPDLIGFVDADMATSPEAYYELIASINSYDGIIASRYMKESKVFPPRPWIKRWGSWCIYESLVKLLFHLNYKDFQCGAKLFKYNVIAKILPYMKMNRWAFDVEILYLCKKFGYSIKEIPTIWYDREGSKLRIRSGFIMLGSLFKLRMRHSKMNVFFKI